MPHWHLDEPISSELDDSCSVHDVGMTEKYNICESGGKFEETEPEGCEKLNPEISRKPTEKWVQANLNRPRKTLRGPTGSGRGKPRKTWSRIRSWSYLSPEDVWDTRERESGGSQETRRSPKI